MAQMINAQRWNNIANIRTHQQSKALWPLPKVSDMNYVIKRMLSFPDPWKYDYNIKLQISNAGFYFLHKDFNVLKCAFCNVVYPLKSLLYRDDINFQDLEHKITCNTSSNKALLLDEKNMSYEQNRFTSFLKQEWPKQPTSTHPVGAVNLAENGMYCDDMESSLVKCAFCSLQVRGWMQGDTAEYKHKQMDGDCPFIKGLEVGNIKLGLEGNSLRKYTSFTSRLDTYQSWPRQIAQKPDQLAAAGFMYTGKGDLVVCYYCRGGLSGWTALAEPWAEHRVNFPSCRHTDNVTITKYISSTVPVYPVDEMIMLDEDSVNLSDDTFASASNLHF